MLDLLFFIIDFLLYPVNFLVFIIFNIFVLKEINLIKDQLKKIERERYAENKRKDFIIKELRSKVKSILNEDE